MVTCIWTVGKAWHLTISPCCCVNIWYYLPQNPPKPKKIWMSPVHEPAPQTHTVTCTHWLVCDTHSPLVTLLTSTCQTFTFGFRTPIWMTGRRFASYLPLSAAQCRGQNISICVCSQTVWGPWWARMKPSVLRSLSKDISCSDHEVVGRTTQGRFKDTNSGATSTPAR